MSNPTATPLLESAQRLLTRPAANADESLVLGLMRGITVFRAVALIWAAIATASSMVNLAHPLAAAALLGVAAVWSGLVAHWPRWGPVLPPTAWWVIVTELALGASLLLADGLVYESIARPVSLPWAWPAAGVMAAGVMYGIRAGLASAVLMVACNLTSDVMLSSEVGESLRAFSRIGLWVVCGALAGYVASQLRQAAIEVSMARAREELARQLHDGVLQTLAVIQRRADDPELAHLARDQELELRGFLSVAFDRPTALEPELRRLAQRHESMFGSRVAVVVADDTPELSQPDLEAMTGAVGEALTNAGKHGEAERVTIYVEPADESATATGGNGPRGGKRGARVFVSVKDDGCGFDPADTVEGMGLSRSIRGRITDAGGRVGITSRPGRGTEVQLWL